jgi:hypothetical protein
MPVRATFNGNITNTGGENPSERGFEWGLYSGSYPNSWTEAGSFSTGTFTHKFTDLPFQTAIYYRAKAKNSAGWGYGSEVSFNTPDAGVFGRRKRRVLPHTDAPLAKKALPQDLLQAVRDHLATEQDNN